MIVGRREDVAKLRQVIVDGRSELAGLRRGITVCDRCSLCCGEGYQFVMAEFGLAARDLCHTNSFRQIARRDCMRKIGNRRTARSFCENNGRKICLDQSFCLSLQPL